MSIPGKAILHRGVSPTACVGPTAISTGFFSAGRRSFSAYFHFGSGSWCLRMTLVVAVYYLRVIPKSYVADTQLPGSELGYKFSAPVAAMRRHTLRIAS